VIHCHRPQWSLNIVTREPPSRQSFRIRFSKKKKTKICLKFKNYLASRTTGRIIPYNNSNNTRRRPVVMMRLPANLDSARGRRSEQDITKRISHRKSHETARPPKVVDRRGGGRERVLWSSLQYHKDFSTKSQEAGRPSWLRVIWFRTFVREDFGLEIRWERRGASRIM